MNFRNQLDVLIIGILMVVGTYLFFVFCMSLGTRMDDKSYCEDHKGRPVQSVWSLGAGKVTCLPQTDPIAKGQDK